MSDENEIDFSGDDGLTLDDLNTESQYIKNPAVGESITLDVAKIVKNNKTQITTKDGVKIDLALSKVDYNYVIHTKDEKFYTCSVWEVWRKIEAICKEKKKTKGFKIKITHVKNGKMGQKGESNYSVEVLED